jgi:hypothetical protein
MAVESDSSQSSGGPLARIDADRVGLLAAIARRTRRNLFRRPLLRRASTKTPTRPPIERWVPMGEGRPAANGRPSLKFNATHSNTPVVVQQQQSKQTIASGRASAAH